MGFGFGAIQAGLFLYEAYRSGHFSRFVVSEVVPEIVEAVRRARGRYRVNIAADAGVDVHEVCGIEILNPTVREDRQILIEAVAEAEEIATALPSVNYYGLGKVGSVIEILTEGLKTRFRRHDDRRSIIYTAENHNRAAEILEKSLIQRLGDRATAGEIRGHVQCLNTVIGKMSGVVRDEDQITGQGLERMTEKAGQCFLVEIFNRIMISRIQWQDFQRGITVFEEKDDLLPFEEAKLYGHNATHALMGYLAHQKGYSVMADIRNDTQLFDLARNAFIKESGKALCQRHKGVDFLFTEQGYRAYADDLLKRMTNPHLRDAVKRVVRDPRRKLAWDDRLIGTMRVALEQGVVPRRYAMGARAALRMLKDLEEGNEERILDQIWSESHVDKGEKLKINELIFQAPCDIDEILSGSYYSGTK